MREVFVSADEQLELMELIACGSGSDCYEDVRSALWDALYSKHGRHVDFDMEEIPEDDLDTFIEWLENDEDE